MHHPNIVNHGGCQTAKTKLVQYRARRGGGGGGGPKVQLRHSSLLWCGGCLATNYRATRVVNGRDAILPVEGQLWYERCVYESPPLAIVHHTVELVVGVAMQY
jgi:hypothetical protein